MEFAAAFLFNFAMIIFVSFCSYSLIVELNRGSDLLLQNANILGLIAGVLGAVGMFGVANFQVRISFFLPLYSTWLLFCFLLGMSRFRKPPLL